MIQEEEMSRSEQMALDMQIAYEMQAKEERRDLKERKKAAAKKVGTEVDGYCTGFDTNNMLYVACEVEGRLVEMLVDSGASCSAISKPMMKKLKLSKKLNKEFAGNAVGCGTSTILGVVENVLVMIGQVEFHLFFLVLDTDSPLIILGLDQMRKFNCIVDLEENKIIFGGKGGVEVQFLPPGENEMARHTAAAGLRGANGDCNVM